MDLGPVLKRLKRKFAELQKGKSSWVDVVSICKGIEKSKEDLTPNKLDKWIVETINCDKNLMVSFLDQVDANDHRLNKFVLDLIPELDMDAMDKGMHVMFRCTPPYYQRILSITPDNIKSVVLLLKYFVTNEPVLCRSLTVHVTIPLHTGFHQVANGMMKYTDWYDEDVFKVYFDVITYLVNNDIVCGRVLKCDLIKGGSEMLWSKWCADKKSGAVIAQNKNLFAIMEQFLADFMTFSYNPAHRDFVLEIDVYRESLESFIPILATISISSHCKSMVNFKDNSDLVNLVKSVNLVLFGLEEQDVNKALGTVRFLDVNEAVTKFAKNDSIGLKMMIKFAEKCSDIEVFTSLLFGLLTSTTTKRMSTDLKYKALLPLVEHNLDKVLNLKVVKNGKISDCVQEVILINFKIVLDYLKLFSSKPKSLPVTVEEVFYQAYLILLLRCDHDNIISRIVQMFKIYLEYYEADMSILNAFINSTGLVPKMRNYLCQLFNVCFLNISSLEETSDEFLALTNYLEKPCSSKFCNNLSLVSGIWPCWLVCKRKIACELLEILYAESHDTFTDIEFGDIKAAKGYKYLCNIIIDILDRDPPHSSRILINLTKCMLKIAESASSSEELYVLEDLVPASMELSEKTEDKSVRNNSQRFVEIIQSR